jgi:hypothetical protein
MFAMIHIIIKRAFSHNAMCIKVHDVQNINNTSFEWFDFENV